MIPKEMSYAAGLPYGLRPLLAEQKSIIADETIDDLSDECLAVEDPVYISPERQKEFEFEEERLAKAFSELPKMRKEILSLLYVQQMAPQEIADELGCSIQHVYNQRSKALKSLRTKLTGGDK